MTSMHRLPTLIFLNLMLNFTSIQIWNSNYGGTFGFDDEEESISFSFPERIKWKFDQYIDNSATGLSFNLPAIFDARLFLVLTGRWPNTLPRRIAPSILVGGKITSCKVAFSRYLIVFSFFVYTRVFPTPRPVSSSVPLKCRYNAEITGVVSHWAGFPKISIAPYNGLCSSIRCLTLRGIPPNWNSPSSSASSSPALPV